MCLFTADQRMEKPRNEQRDDVKALALMKLSSCSFVAHYRRCQTVVVIFLFFLQLLHSAQSHVDQPFIAEENLMELLRNIVTR